MSSSEHPSTTGGSTRPAIVVVLALAVAAIIGGVVGFQAVAAPSPSSALPLVTAVGDGGGGRAPDARGPHGRPAPGPALPDGVTIDDGVVPDGVTVFDDEFAAVANLDPDLLGVLRQAATAAAGDGVEFFVTSGWRSPAYQDRLLREAVAEYGSEEEAARWVAMAETSLHVSGDAVDIGPFDATAWLSEHGAEYGLCQVYDNEPWHYELRSGAVDHGCPTRYADPTHDPRMQQ